MQILLLKTEFYTLDDGRVVGFCMHGHCGWSDKGKDIVCAAVSSAVYMVINTITDVLKASVEDFILDEGEVKVVVSRGDIDICRSLFEGLKLHLIGLESLYPKNVRVDYREVSLC